MKKFILSILLAIGILSLINGQQSSQSKDKGWEKIGQTTINLSEEHGIFDWNSDREKTINADNKYSVLKFRVKNANINLINVEAQYDDGKKENLQYEKPVPPETEQQFRLDASQDVEKINFSFFNGESTASDKAVVEIWGKKADASGMGQGTDDRKDMKDININVNSDTVKVKR
ncbi:MAG TPA: hypothetical protein VK213_07360 [Bacteroidales bacterium]|nr:hypothetical protein [Bacteroidales bacterium]